VLCAGAQIGFRTSRVREIAVRLAMGAATYRQCTQFGGTIIDDSPAAADRPVQGEGRAAAEHLRRP
jgi:hypothetical protein